MAHRDMVEYAKICHLQMHPQCMAVRVSVMERADRVHHMQSFSVAVILQATVLDNGLTLVLKYWYWYWRGHTECIAWSRESSSMALWEMVGCWYSYLCTRCIKCSRESFSMVAYQG